MNNTQEQELIPESNSDKFTFLKAQTQLLWDKAAEVNLEPNDPILNKLLRTIDNFTNTIFTETFKNRSPKAGEYATPIFNRNGEAISVGYKVDEQFDRGIKFFKAGWRGWEITANFFDGATSEGLTHLLNNIEIVHGNKQISFQTPEKHRYSPSSRNNVLPTEIIIATIPQAA